METKYYCVGFHWDGENPSSQLDRFLKDEIWENGYEDKFHKTVNNVPVGARLAAKTTYTRKENGQTISVLEVHALGTVTENPRDGQMLKVNWDKNFPGRFSLDGRGAYRSTISAVHNPENIRRIFSSGATADISPATTRLTFDVEDLSNDFPCNVILFGPPGTGKTFRTVNKAVAIAEGIKEDKLSKWFPNRTDLKDRFDELLIENWEKPSASGQIAYITFHQSMNYEDFIEGLKPVINDEGEVTYEVVPGIFKRIAELALDNWMDAQKGEKTELSFDEALSRLRDEWEDNNSMTFGMKTAGKGFKLTKWTNKSIEFEKSTGSRLHTFSKKTLRDYYYHPNAVRKSGVGIYYPGVLEKLYSYSAPKQQEKVVKNYVLVIDEINRGNISQIFGELITLIEEDKRYDNRESMAVMLPYSQESFAVPPNLFLIGTMNTADRSVEALDAALRRRFSFEEMLPKPELLAPSRLLWKFWWDNAELDWDDKKLAEREKRFYDLIGFPENMNTEAEKERFWEPMRREGVAGEHQVGALKDLSGKFTGIDLSLLLAAINKRLEMLLGKDYVIGHAYLIDIRSVEEFKNVFFQKIIPLLQEYFYGDIARIGLVIGAAFLEVVRNDEVSFFKVDGFNDGDLSDRYVYHIKKAVDFPDHAAFLEAVKRIYASPIN